MRYYTIQNGSLLIADSFNALARFYGDIQPLPEDYEEGKYIVVESKEEIEVPDFDPETGEMIGFHIEIKVTYTLELNPNFEAEQEAKEKERVGNLKCTKRVFALMLQELGITYTQLKTLISSNEQAELEWDLCVELERKNPLLDIMAGTLGITPVQLDGLFKYANGEITIEEFRGLIQQPDVNNSEPIDEENSVVEDVTDVEDVNNLEEESK
ncbi:MAG: hypothetical protein II304_03135 [Bacteroidales bacterium]|nr:hypothetical protein [Bacteroidales bacterium]